MTRDGMVPLDELYQTARCTPDCRLTMEWDEEFEAVIYTHRQTVGENVCYTRFPIHEASDLNISTEELMGFLVEFVEEAHHEAALGPSPSNTVRFG